MSHLMNDKIPQRGCGVVQRPNLLILDPVRKFGTGIASNFKFGIRRDLGMSHLTDDKML